MREEEGRIQEREKENREYYGRDKRKMKREKEQKGRIMVCEKERRERKRK